MLHVMIDLETMSLRPDAAIIAIGAVKFDPKGKIGELGDPGDPEYKHFYWNVALQTSMDAGLHVDGGTIMWWLQQSGAARDALSTAERPAVPLQLALNEFLIWYGPESVPTWGNGAAFDLVVLKNAYRAFDVQPPWSYKHERCYRSFNAVLPETEYLPPAIEHNPLEDAMAQAYHLQKLFNFIVNPRD